MKKTFLALHMSYNVGKQTMYNPSSSKIHNPKTTNHPLWLYRLHALCRTWLETPEAGFLLTWLKCLPSAGKRKNGIVYIAICVAVLVNSDWSELSVRLF